MEPGTDKPQYKPAGYCPHCGYAIDPGKCPECGNTTASGDLDASPYWVARRRRIKRAFCLLLAVGCTVGGVYPYRNPSLWMPYVPTRVLLRWQGGEGSLTITELERRRNAGTLTQTDADKMLDQALTFPDGLGIRSPHPRDVEMQLDLALVRRAVWPGSLWVDFSEVSVDGTVVPWVHDRPTRRDWRYMYDGRGERIRLDSLIDPPAVGDHEITWQIVFSLKPESARAEILVPTCSKTLAAHVRVEDKTVDHFVRPVVDADIAEQMRQRIGLVIGSQGEGEQAYGRILVEALPVALAANLQARPAGSEEYRPCSPFVFSQGSNCSSGWWLGTTDTYSVGSRVDVRLVPNAALAFRAGLGEYFGGVIEWKDVIIRELWIGSVTDDLASGKNEFPTRISTSPVSVDPTEP